MAKKASIAATDAALNYTKNNAERLVLCSAEPANFAGVSSVALADVAFAPAAITVGATAGGRQYQTDQKSGVTIDTTGTVTHVAFVKDSTSELLDVTTTPSTAVSAGGTATIASFRKVINDAT